MSKLPDYPRAAPYQEPTKTANGEAPSARLQTAAQRESQLRRWMLQVAGGTIAIVMLTVGLGVYLVIQAVQSRPSRVAVMSGSESPRAAEKQKPEIMPERPERQAPPMREASAGREPALEAVGALSGSHLYQTYLNIGLLADAAENDVYDDAEANRLLTSIVQRMDQVDGQFARLTATGLSSADQQRLTRVRQLTGLLRNQAKALRTYWNAPENDAPARKESEARFHQARAAAWDGIKDLLNLPDE